MDSIELLLYCCGDAVTRADEAQVDSIELLLYCCDAAVTRADEAEWTALSCCCTAVTLLLQYAAMTLRHCC